MKPVAFVVAAAACCLVSQPGFGEIIAGQVDDFEDGTTMGWIHGSPFSPNRPTNIADGGPSGNADNFLRNTSTGSPSVGGKMVVVIRTRWTGNFAALNVAELRVSMANFGATTLHARLGLQGPVRVFPLLQTRLVSTGGVLLPADGVWRDISFRIDAAGFTADQGIDSVADVLTAVTEMRFLAAAGPAWRGDAVAGTLGIDNVTVVVPEPACVFAVAVLTLVASRRGLRVRAASA
jgi:hypothetical protein